MKRFLTIALLLTMPVALPAQDKSPEAKELAREIAPYLDDQLLAVLHVDLSRFDADAADRALQKAGVPPAHLEQPMQAAKALLTMLKGAGLKRGFAVVSFAEIPDQPPLLVIPADKEGNVLALTKILERMLEQQKMRFEKRDGFIVGGTARALKRLSGLKPVERPELAEAFARLDDSAIKVVVTPGDTLRQAFGELAPMLPRELGGGPSTVLTRGVRWLAVGVSPPAGASVRLVIHASDASSAKALTAMLARTIETATKSAEVREALPGIEKLLAAIEPRQEGERVELVVKEEVLLGVVLPLLQKTREAAGRQIHANNLKQIGLAFHNHAAENRDHFPTSAIYSKDGKPLLSWRVALLPHIEQGDLYRQFKLDEPWDSEHNKKLIARMPKVYASSPDPKVTAAGKTTYVVPVGEDTAFTGKKPLRIQTVSDGTSNTVLTVDVADEQAVIWTKPDDWQYDAKAPAKGLRKHGGKQFLIGMMDGSVRFLSAMVDPKTIHGIVTPNGGEVVELP